jgi:hypothetical protein
MLQFALTTRRQAAERFEKHCEDHGKPQDDAEAKKILAGFTDTFIDGMAVRSHPTFSSPHSN